MTTVETAGGDPNRFGTVAFYATLGRSFVIMCGVIPLLFAIELLDRGTHHELDVRAGIIPHRLDGLGPTASSSATLVSSTTTFWRAVASDSGPAWRASADAWSISAWYPAWRIWESRRASAFCASASCSFSVASRSCPANTVTAWSGFAPNLDRWMKVMQNRGPAAVQRAYLDTLNGRVPPDQGLILSLSE